MRFRQANGARPTSVKRAHSLGECTFNAGPQRVLLLKLCRGLAVPRRLEGFMVDLGPDGERARFGFRAGTGATHRTRPAVFVGKANLDHLLAGHVPVGLPLPTLFALWTRGRVGLPVDGKGAMLIDLLYGSA